MSPSLLQSRRLNMMAMSRTHSSIETEHIFFVLPPPPPPPRYEHISISLSDVLMT